MYTKCVILILRIQIRSQAFFGNVGSGWIPILYTRYGNEQGSATLGGKKGNLPGAKTLNFTGSFLGRICSLFLLEVAVLDPEKSPSAILPKKGLGSDPQRLWKTKLWYILYSSISDWIGTSTS